MRHRITWAPAIKTSSCVPATLLHLTPCRGRALGAIPAYTEMVNHGAVGPSISGPQAQDGTQADCEQSLGQMPRPLHLWEDWVSIAAATVSQPAMPSCTPMARRAVAPCHILLAVRNVRLKVFWLRAWVLHSNCFHLCSLLPACCVTSSGLFTLAVPQFLQLRSKVNRAILRPLNGRPGKSSRCSCCSFSVV